MSTVRGFGWNESGRCASIACVGMSARSVDASTLPFTLSEVRNSSRVTATVALGPSR